MLGECVTQLNLRALTRRFPCFVADGFVDRGGRRKMQYDKKLGGRSLFLCPTLRTCDKTSELPFDEMFYYAFEVSAECAPSSHTPRILRRVLSFRGRQQSAPTPAPFYAASQNPAKLHHC